MMSRLYRYWVEEPIAVVPGGVWGVAALACAWLAFAVAFGNPAFFIVVVVLAIAVLWQLLRFAWRIIRALLG